MTAQQFNLDIAFEFIWRYLKILIPPELATYTSMAIFNANDLCNNGINGICIPPEGIIGSLTMLPEEFWMLFTGPISNNTFVKRSRRQSKRKMAAYVVDDKVFVFEVIEPKLAHLEMIEIARFGAKAFYRAYKDQMCE